METMTRVSAVRSPVAASRYGPIDPPCDGYVSGQIGRLSLMSGCYSFFEAWTLAAEEIARAGRYPEAIARLDAGATVRSLLAEWFGVSSESAPGNTAFYETRAVRRTLRNARARVRE